MRFKELLTERISSIVFHYTNLFAATKIISSGEFELSSTLGTDVESAFAPTGYPYFLSTTRTMTGGYHDYVGSGAAIFVLNGDWFNKRYPGKAVDYWQNRDPKLAAHRRHEAEDRIFSKDPTIPIGGVESLHVFLREDADARYRQLTRRLLIAAKTKNIPAYFYTDETAWRRLDTSKQGSVTVLTGGDEPKGYTRGHRGYLMPWMELLFGRDKTKLSKKANSLLYSLNYSYDRTSSRQGLATDLSNARKPNSGPDREHAVKIAQYMRKNKLADLAALIDNIKQRWVELTKSDVKKAAE